VSGTAPHRSVSAETFEALSVGGLNLHAVFERDCLPEELRRALTALSPLPRVVLIGHGGRALWSNIESARTRGDLSGPHPIDTYSVRLVRNWLAGIFPEAQAHLLYPLTPSTSAAPVATIDLQALGACAGWHHPSPFMVGINTVWGSWFAYRVALLTDAPIEPTRNSSGASPCGACVNRDCVAACPAGALATNFDLARCAAYRLRRGSECALTCQARLVCPIGHEYRYADAQLAHCYGESLRMLKAFSKIA
jgi:epoxyqueuosine reductase